MRNCVTVDTKQTILEHYIQTLRDTGKPPVSVSAVCTALNLGEREFFTAFATLDAVEARYWEAIVDRVVLAVEAGAEWPGFNARQRLLAFFYAFCEESLDCRSLMLLRLAPLGPLARPAILRGFENRFKQFAETVVSHGIAGNEIAGRGKLSMLYPEAIYLQFRAIIDFNLKDDSAGFERTDAFIEKSAALAFDLLAVQAIDSAWDLMRFLLPKPRGLA